MGGGKSHGSDGVVEVEVNHGAGEWAWWTLGVLEILFGINGMVDVIIGYVAMEL